MNPQNEHIFFTNKTAKIFYAIQAFGFGIVALGNFYLGVGLGGIIFLLLFLIYFYVFVSSYFYPILVFRDGKFFRALRGKNIVPLTDILSLEPAGRLFLSGVQFKQSQGRIIFWLSNQDSERVMRLFQENSKN